MGWIRGQAGMGSFDCGSRFASESASYAQDDKGRRGIAGEPVTDSSCYLLPAARLPNVAG